VGLGVLLSLWDLVSGGVRVIDRGRVAVLVLVGVFDSVRVLLIDRGLVSVLVLMAVLVIDGVRVGVFERVAVLGLVGVLVRVLAFVAVRAGDGSGSVASSSPSSSASGIA
jgi:hypothetical protein